jgi:hydrogenase expression/formation protein HypD
MKYLDEFRSPEDAKRITAQIHEVVTQPWGVMEVCGGQTHSIVRFGIDQMLPDLVSLIHGPGCPVCVTPVELIDQALAIAARPEVIFCSFGDMLRVPGTQTDLFRVKAEGGDVRVVYSPMDALKLAMANPDRQVVFFGVGFETTAPTIAMAIDLAHKQKLPNFSVLVSHVLVPPALEAVASAPDRQVHGFLAAGHVCTVMGTHEYDPIAARFGMPIVVTGFEPTDILRGLLMCLTQLEQGRAEVENAYARSVRPDGNVPARTLIGRVFQVVDRAWRGIGVIPTSGLALSEEYAWLDAAARFDVASITADEDPGCMAGLVLQGKLKPMECPEFGRRCTPDHPLGATMVSSEGACAAYYRYRRT